MQGSEEMRSGLCDYNIHYFKLKPDNFAYKDGGNWKISQLP